MSCGFDKKVEKNQLQNMPLYANQNLEKLGFTKFDDLNCTISFIDREDIKRQYRNESERCNAYTNAIKEELNKGNVVSIGLDLVTGISANNLWNGLGMSATTTFTNGKWSLDLSNKLNPKDCNTWDIFKELASAMEEQSNRQQLAGHQMVIIGYCDNPKVPNRGIFILRNSWGAKNGIQGNNFATYEYTYTCGNDPISIGNK